MPDPLRVVVLGAGHYHAAYYPVYLDLLRKHGGELVGLSDPDPAVARSLATRVDTRAFDSDAKMLEATKPDFALGLGRHVDMPGIFRTLVDAGVPFLMEKPWGIDAATVRELAALAESRGAWVATPFSFRYSFWAQQCRNLFQAGELGKVSHILFRMVRPGVARYIEQGSDWMLRRESAGGGVLLNLGVHGFDLCRFITGEEPEIFSAVVSNAVFGLDIEDYASVTLRTPGGIVFQNEVGYTYPNATGRDDERKLASSAMLLRDGDGGFTKVTADGEEFVPQPEGFLSMWEGVVADCLGRVRSGEPPPMAPGDTARAVALVFEAYERAGWQ